MLSSTPLLKALPSVVVLDYIAKWDNLNTHQNNFLFLILFLNGQEWFINAFENTKVVDAVDLFFLFFFIYAYFFFVAIKMSARF